MPYDAAFPTEHTEILAEEFREQFHGLKDLIDAVPVGPQGPQGQPGNDGAQGETGPQGPAGPAGEVTTAALLSAVAGTSANSNAVATLGMAVEPSYDAAQVQAIASKLDELIAALRR